MSVEAIDFISPSLSLADLTNLDKTEKTGSGFSAWVEHELATVNNQINTSEMELRKLATGETDNLHQVMMSLEKAKLSFELVMQLRNKTLEAYQEIMRMQV